MKKSVKVFLIIVLFAVVIANTIFNGMQKYSVKEGEELVLLIDLDKKNNKMADYSLSLDYDQEVLELLDKDSFNNTLDDANVLDSVSKDDDNKYVLVTNKDSELKDTLKVTFKVKDDVDTNKTIIRVKDIVDKSNDTSLKEQDIKVKIITGNFFDDNMMNIVNSIAVVLLVVLLITTFYDIKNTASLILSIILVLGGVLLGFNSTSKNKDIIDYNVEIKNIKEDDKEDNKTPDNNDKENNNGSSSKPNNSIVNNNGSTNESDDTEDNNDSSNKPDNTENNNHDTNDNEDNTNKDDDNTLTGGDEDDSKDDEDVKVDITAKIVNSLVSNYYPAKKSMINLYYEVDTNCKEDVISFEINGNKYKAIKENNIYKVNYNVANDAGIENIQVTKIYFENAIVNVNYEHQVDVLKNKPVIDNFTAQDKDGNLVITFDLIDNDKSFIKGSVSVKDSKGNEVFNSKINTGKNEYTYKAKDNGEYTTQVNISYDLDTNKLNSITGDKNENTENIINQKTMVITDYKFTFDNVQIKSVDKEKKLVTIDFVSSNISIYNVNKVIINNKEYNVTKNDNNYEVVINLEDTSKQNIEITKVILDNDKAFEVKKEFVVFKNIPVIKDLKIDYNEQERLVKVSYNLEDKDKVLTKQYVVLKDNLGNVITTKELNDNTTGFVLDNVDNAGIYTIEVLGDYDVVDGLLHSKELLSRKEFTIDLKVSISNTSINYYPNKGEEIEILYTVDSNTKDIVESFTINGKKYNALLVNDNIYKVIYKVKDTIGIEDINLTSINYKDVEVPEDVKVKVDVLKEVPTIDNYVFDDNKTIPVLTFKLNDEDKAFIKGKIVIIDDKGNNIKEINVIKDQEDYEIEGLEENKVYSFKVEVTYDLDSDKLNSITGEQNEVTETLLSGYIDVVHDYNFSYNNLQIVKIDKTNRKIELKFDSTNGSPFGVERVVINGHSYDVIRDGNTYSTEITLDNTNETRVVLTDIVLENGHLFNITKDNSVIVFKNAPILDEFQLFNDKRNTLEAKYAVLDESKTITKLYAQLIDEFGNVIETREIGLNDGVVTFTNLEVGEYEVAILADYDLVDGNNYQKVALGEHSLSVLIVLDTLENVSISNYYPNKEQNIVLEYKISSNTNKDVLKLVINGNEYDAIKNNKDNYEVTYKVSSNAGIEEIKVEKVIYEIQTIEELNYINKIDVLKDVPSISNYLSDIDYTKRTVTITFDIIDKDNSLLKDNDGNIVNLYGQLSKCKDENNQEKVNLKVGHNKLVFVNVPLNEVLKFEVFGNYDLDTDELNSLLNKDDNEFSNKLVNEFDVVVIPPSILNVHSLKTFNEKEETKYFNKDEKIKLSFEAKTVHPDGSDSIYYPVTALIDGNEYKLNSSNGIYNVELPGYASAGKQDITIQSIILSNEEEIVIDDTNKTSIEVDILKDDVYVTDFNYSEDANKNVTIKFNVNDNDKALVDGKVLVLDVNNKMIDVKPEKITRGENTIVFNALDGELFTFKVIATYDKDSEEGNDNLVTDKELLVEDVNVSQNIDYNLVVDSFDVVKVDTDNSKVTLKINSSNDSSFLVDKVVINGVTYNVRLDSNQTNKMKTYYVDMVVDNNKRVVLKLENIILKNEKKFNVSKETIIFKNKPVVDDIYLANNIDSQLDAEIKITDKDKTLTKLYAVLKDEKGIVKKEEVLNIDDRNVSFTELAAGEYTVEILADYNTVDGVSHQKELLASDPLFYVKPVVDISVINISNKYPKKGEQVEVQYKIESNVNEKVTSLEINGQRYDVEEVEPFVYKIIYKDTSVVGATYLNITKINFEEEIMPLDNGYTTRLDVLKIDPVVKNIQITDDKNNQQFNISYELEDVDKTIDNLKLMLIDSNNNVVATEDNVKDKKNINVSYANSSMSGGYTVKFLADYNLGTDIHSYTSVNIGEEKIFTQSEVTITKIEVGVVGNSTVINQYPSRKQTSYQIRFTVSASEAIRKKYNGFSGVTINGVDYDGGANRFNANGVTSTTINYVVPDKAGIIELNIDKIKLSSESYQGTAQAFFAVAPTSVTIDVLRNKPSIQNLEVVKEDYQNGNVTFKFNVIEDNGGFEHGYVSLNNQKYEIHVGENTVEFTNVLKDTELKLSFYGDYDLDTDTIEEGKNNYKDQLLYEENYGLYSTETYNNIELINVVTNSDNNDNYFEKEEKVNLKFDVVNSDSFEIEKIIIGEDEYNVELTDNGYTATLNGYDTYGIKDISIKEIVLKGGKKIKLAKPVNTKIEVLKDVVKVNDFKFEEDTDNINLKISLKDVDNSLVGNVASSVIVKVYDEDGNEIDTYPYSGNISIPKKGNVRYYVKVIASYDRDSVIGNDNANNEVEIYQDVVSIDKNYIELKDIINVILFKENNDKVEEVESVQIDDLTTNTDSYFVRIEMNQMTSVHSKIKKVITDDDKLVLVLDYEYTVKEKEVKNQELKITFGSINNGQADNEVRPLTLEELIDKINNNPDATIILTRDYDMSLVNVDTDSYFDVDFTGTFDGNGYTLRNLNKPLFNSITNGTVKNVKINNINITSNTQLGSLANTTSGATIKDILVKNLVKSNSNHDGGGLIGKATNNTIIENSKITGLRLSVGWNAQRNGGLVGTLQNSKINNSYVVGIVSANWNFIGALVGNSYDSEITNSYVKVTISGNITCDLACSIGGSSIYRNNVSLTTGAKNGFASRGTYENNYRLVNDGSVSTTEGITNISTDEVDSDLFKKALFDEKIWNLKNVSYADFPTFNTEKTSSVNINEVGDDYDETKELLYNNLMILMPFYDSTKIVNTAKLIDNDSILANHLIIHVVPVDNEGNVVTYLTTADVKKIQKLIIIFDNGERKEYNLRFDKVYDMVASYRISELKIDYTYKHYVIDNNSNLVNSLVDYLNSLTYVDNLDILTPSTDSRIYKDFYNEVTRNELREFVLKYISNSDYIVTNTNISISDYLESELKKDQSIEKALYVYNYFRRFYDAEINGIKLYDFILFNSNGFDSGMTFEEIVKGYLSKEENFQTNRTSDVYYNVLSKYTGLSNIPELLEYLVNMLSDMDVADWYADQFRGKLVELNVDGRPDIEYRLWDHISTQDKNTRVNWYNYALPIITIPEQAAYIITTPGQFIIGAQRTYINDPFDPADQAKFQEKIDTYTKRMKDYYTTAAAIIEDAEVFNNIHTIQIDKRFAYENGVMTSQNPYSTQEPFHKNFNEVIWQWAYADGNAATANGAYIIWRAEGVLDGEWTYRTWSHETAHNMDARLFLKDNGRRFDAGGEDYADGNLNQTFNAHDIVMNLSMQFTKEDNIAVNNLPSRIDSKEKIWDFYKKLFETVYIMDYLEGQAFLKLTPEEQSKLAVQVSYPREATNTLAGHEYLKRQHTVYQEISEEAIRNMHLNSLDDLYDNKLVMYPGVIYSTLTTNRYGCENLLKVRWYQPHNDEGRPDSYSIKWWAYEMLGYAGYDDGYIEYYSNINSVKKTIANVASDGVNYVYDNNGNIRYSEVDYKTDLMALQTITKDKDMTFKKYRQNRFGYVEDNLENIQIIDVNEYFDKFYKALKEDAKAVKEAQEEALRRFPGNTKEDIDKRNNYINSTRVKYFEKSSAVRDELYFAMKNGTNDFEGLVYDSSHKQEVEDFVVPSTIAVSSLSIITNEDYSSLAEKKTADVLEGDNPPKIEYAFDENIIVNSDSSLDNKEDSTNEEIDETEEIEEDKYLESNDTIDGLEDDNDLETEEAPVEEVQEEVVTEAEEVLDEEDIDLPKLKDSNDQITEDDLPKLKEVS